MPRITHYIIFSRRFSPKRTAGTSFPVHTNTFFLSVFAYTTYLKTVTKQIRVSNNLRRLYHDDKLIVLIPPGTNASQNNNNKGSGSDFHKFIPVSCKVNIWQLQRTSALHLTQAQPSCATDPMLMAGRHHSQSLWSRRYFCALYFGVLRSAFVLRVVGLQWYQYQYK